MLYFLSFIVGATVVFLFFKYRVKKITNQITGKTDALLNDPANTFFEDVPEPFHLLLNKIKSRLQQSVSSPTPPTNRADETERLTALQKLIDNLYIVNELGQKVTSSLNLQQTFQHLHTTINSMMDAAVLELTVYNEISHTRNYFSNLNLVSNEASYINHIAEWCYKNNREVFLANAEQDFGRYVFQSLILPGNKPAQSIMVFPINSNENISGTLSIISFQKNSFDSYHQEIIRLLIGYIAVAMDNALTHDELNLTKIRAEQSEKFKEKFLANMSHEIRTPINAVTGMTRLLLEKSPREDQLRYLESIRNASDSLVVIINDILDLSKIEAGKIELEQIDFSVREVIKNVIEIMNFKAEEKGLILEIKSDPSIQNVLIGDPTRLTQILINLIGNAIKFTEKGTIQLSVKQDSGSDKNIAILTFKVSDTGIGMTKEQQGKLFQDYAQASSETARKYGGTGLGLSISKQLIQLQGGNIEVKSELGKGSDFTFTLSYPISKSKLILQKEQSISKEMLMQLNGVKVLLADDNEYNRIVAKETLELKLENVKVDEAFDGAMAIEMILKNNYDVVLMDLVMPVMNGIEATRKIRSELKSPKNNINILVLTASVEKSQIEKCIAAGMNGFIPKPFKPNELIRAIYNSLHGGINGPIEPNRNSEELKSTVNTQIDLVFLLEFTEGDTIRMRRHIDLFNQKIPSNLLLLQQAFEKEDFENIRILSHSMKPQLKIMGVKQGFDIAEKIEQYCTEKTNLDQLQSLISQLKTICEVSLSEMEGINL